MRRTLAGMLLTAVVGLAFAESPAMAFTDFTFTATDGDWSDPNNWSPNGTPGSSDTATIPSGKTCRISNANQAIKILNVEGTLYLENGKLLDWGQNATSTSSDLDGTIYFKEGAYVYIHGTVTLTGSGLIDSSKSHGGDYGGSFTCDGVNHAKLILTSDILVRGSMLFWLDLKLDGIARVNHADDVLSIGSGVSCGSGSRPVISGTGLFDISDGQFNVSYVNLNDDTDGMPNWELSGGTTKIGSAYLGGGTQTKVKIDMCGGTLDVDRDFGSTKDLTWCGGTIKVDASATFVME
ncbi:MAG: hypothetical protein FLDDKLPJ_00659 [Phycisphaerae bacterium]|nr:hypothetical protein [Phycisphaerae bacterium]